MFFDSGTIFLPQIFDYTTPVLEFILNANFTPTDPSVSATQLSSAIDQLLQLYPDIPALGSPYNTGNETFGLGSGYKRAASISK